jgi:superfamily I DNA/RNA helicase
MKEKLKNPKTKCYTMHGLSLSVMKYNLEKTKHEVQLDNFKIHKIISDIFKDEYQNNKKLNTVEYKDYLQDNYVTLYNVIRLKCIEILNEDTVDWICDELGIFQNTSEFEAHTANEMLSWIERIDSISLSLFEKDQLIDFTDMLYITLKKLQCGDWNMPFWLLFTNIYYDEFQDASLLHQKLIRYFKRSGGRFIFIYDKNQAIYGFAGADCRATENVDKLFTPVEHFKLPVNYRCGSEILNYVNRQFGVGILPRPNANIGNIIRIDENVLSKKVKPNDFIVGRKNQQLISTALMLVRSGIRIFLSDKEIVVKLTKTIKTIKQKNVANLLEYCNKFLKEYGELPEKERTKYNREDIDLIVTLINNFFKDNNSTLSTTDKLINYIQSMINTDDPNGCVRIMSIHKSKGLEAENVFVLNEGRVFVELGRSKDMIQQERNLSYVALTRAKENLYLVRCKSDEKEKANNYEFEF